MWVPRLIYRVKGLNRIRPRTMHKFYSSSNNQDKDLVPRDNNEIKKHREESSTSPASPAPMNSDSRIQKLLKTDNKPYIPKLNHNRLSYEYPGLPNQDDFPKTINKTKVSRWSRYIPKILSAVVVVWGIYSIKVWIYAPEEGSDSQELLSPAKFHKFIVTHVDDLGSDCYLIELTPKFNHWVYSYGTSESVWNGDRIWSVEVKQPDINVVRSYTPLPLYFMKSEYTRSGEKKPLLRVVENDSQDCDKGGVMCLYVKKYGDGEVSRYITSRKNGDELELRGPHIDYRFPFHPAKKLYQRPIFRDLPSKVDADPLIDLIKHEHKLPDIDNLTFYAAGTGIAPILQVLLSRNPYRGFVTLHYSAKKPGEILAFERFIYFLEKLDRAKFIPHYDSTKNSQLSSKDIGSPEKPNYISSMRASEQNRETTEESLRLRLNIISGEKMAEEKVTPAKKESQYFSNAIDQAIESSKTPKKGSSLALVCGPDGYIDFLAGCKGVNGEQYPVEGLLGKKGWDETNVYKL